MYSFKITLSKTPTRKKTDASIFITMPIASGSNNQHSGIQIEGVISDLQTELREYGAAEQSEDIVASDRQL